MTHTPEYLAEVERRLNLQSRNGDVLEGAIGPFRASLSRDGDYGWGAIVGAGSTEFRRTREELTQSECRTWAVQCIADLIAEAGLVIPLETRLLCPWCGRASRWPEKRECPVWRPTNGWGSVRCGFTWDERDDAKYRWVRTG